ncbi:hypothetical protein GCM10009555_050550 [Acrocarpospora macrocephala]|uniref:Uncharacterized protein n=1 Tax=Acrocarpospora macrocephala TaxID=150177 RepID=A0A5M3X6B4_9ACTN|nr:hypothetical protein Amac_098040 [Acrocarpospora macrocephala]
MREEFLEPGGEHGFGDPQLIPPAREGADPQQEGPLQNQEHPTVAENGQTLPDRAEFYRGVTLYCRRRGLHTRHGNSGLSVHQWKVSTLKGSLTS